MDITSNCNDDDTTIIHNNVSIDWSNLNVPLGSRCSGVKELTCNQGNAKRLFSLPWYFLNNDCIRGSGQNNKYVNTKSIKHLNLKCSGIPTLDLDTILTMSDSLLSLDISDNSFDTNSIKSITVDAPWPEFKGITHSFSYLWYVLGELKHIQNIQIRNTNLDDDHFDLVNALWIDSILTKKNISVHENNQEFSVVGSNVNTLNWALPTFLPYETCLMNCDFDGKIDYFVGCCILDSERSYVCPPYLTSKPRAKGYQLKEYEYQSCERSKIELRMFQQVSTSFNIYYSYLFS